MKRFVVFLTFMLWVSCLKAEPFTIAAASDLRFALDEIIETYKQNYPGHSVTVIYGSSGRMSTQISNGAPFDIFFSADIAFPLMLQEQGLTATEPSVYAIGRLVLWSSRMDASQMTLSDLTSDRIRRIAIAQPAHAPYGQRAQEAMQQAGVWDQVQHKLVFAENIAQAAQMAESGAADIGVIALSLALFPSMQTHAYHLIDDNMHQALTQGFVVTKVGADKKSIRQFADFMATEAAHEIMVKYGFVLPGDTLPDNTL
ncbi:MAG: molybdate ABC transporter substrate-binding protein [Pseudohongiella sp.]|nr:molybdate ABC transporter substrate-binding protein [Pseudohongiella sp.]